MQPVESGQNADGFPYRAHQPGESLPCKDAQRSAGAGEEKQAEEASLPICAHQRLTACARSRLVWSRRSTSMRVTALLKAFWQPSVAARSASARISMTVTLVRAVTVVLRRE